MLPHLYQKCQISYVLRVTHYQDPMALVWVELWMSIWIFQLKLGIMGIHLIFLVPFSFSTLGYYQFSKFHIDVFFFCCNSRLSLDFVWDESCWGYSLSRVGYYICFTLLLVFVWGLCAHNSFNKNWTQHDCWVLLVNHPNWSYLCLHILNNHKSCRKFSGKIIFLIDPILGSVLVLTL